MASVVVKTVGDAKNIDEKTPAGKFVQNLARTWAVLQGRYKYKLHCLPFQPSLSVWCSACKTEGKAKVNF